MIIYSRNFLRKFSSWSVVNLSFFWLYSLLRFWNCNDYFQRNESLPPVAFLHLRKFQFFRVRMLSTEKTVMIVSVRLLPIDICGLLQNYVFLLTNFHFYHHRYSSICRKIRWFSTFPRKTSSKIFYLAFHWRAAYSNKL